MYDIVGDIHGHATLLKKLLKELGYTMDAGTYHHPERTIIFTGDIINRGPEIRETIQIIRSMVEADAAKMVLGNHEFNAILYRTRDTEGNYFLKHAPRYKLPLMKTLDEFERYPEEWKDTIKWFRTLPFFLDLDDIRVVHAAWINEHINFLKQFSSLPKIKKAFLESYMLDADFTTAVNLTTKGQEMLMPRDLIIKDDKGIMHRKFRVKWWKNLADKTFREISFGNRFKLPNYSIPQELVPDTHPYPENDPILFFGHYCLENGSQVLTKNLCCVDSCIARTKSLSVYRWSGEKKLKPKNLITVK